MQTIMRGLLVSALVATAGLTLSAQSPRSDQAIVPFKIAVPDAVLRDLKERLVRTRFGPVTLGTLAAGKTRKLTGRERATIDALVR